MKLNTNNSESGFTLAEICVVLAVISLVGAAGYTMLINSTTLLAKNVSLNSSNLLARSALDRIFAELNQANRMVLINADGTALASGNPGPAAGILVDRYVGGPYVVGNPGGGLPANANTFKLFYSTNALASPPIPAKNDVVIMDGVTRALVSSSVATSTLSSPIPSPSPTDGKMVTVTLQNNLGTYTSPPVSTGTAIPWSSSTQQTAYVLHRKAFVVVPGSDPNGPAELRLYPDAETTMSDFSNPANYIVLTRGIGTKTVDGVTENTPFSFVTETGGVPPANSTPQFLKIAMRLEDQQFNKRLAKQQAGEFNTFFRVDTVIRPRNLTSL